MNCGRSSSVEWKLPKLQRRVRFPSPAPAPPGHAPGGFVMPTSHPPSTECGGQSAQHFPRASWGPRFRYKTHPARPTRHQSRYKTHPTRATRCQSRYKTHPTRPKCPNLARFALAGRVLSRFCCQQAEHGEFSPATTNNKPGTPPVPIQNSPSTPRTPPVPVQNSPSTPKMSQFGAFCSCWESFIPFLLPTSRAWRVFSRTNTSTTTGTKETTPPTQHTKPRDEILSAPAPHTAPHNETFTAPARHKQPKFSHFHHAGANFLSQHTPHTHTGATFLSTNASAGKIDPNKTFIIFDSVITSRPDRKDIGDGAPITTRRSSALDTAPMHQIAQHCTGN